MRASGTVQRLWLLCSALALLFVAVVARAEPAGLPAVISAGGSGLDAERIRSGIERELGVALVPAPDAEQRLEVALTGRRANVTYYAPGREPVTRSVDLPRDDERALETIAFLAGNLARDEAAELLAQLAPAPAAEQDSAPPPPPPAAAPSATAEPQPPPPAPARATPEPTPRLIESDHFVGNVSLYWPLTGLPRTEERRLNLELGVLYSRVGAIHGAGGTFGYFRSDGLVEGFSVGFFWNRSGPVRGLQLSALVNEGYGELRGASFASFADVRDGDARGAQGSFVFASSHLAFGIQGAGIAAVAREVAGVQGAGIVAVAGPVRGGQFGLVSVARRLQGLELGLVNVAGSVSGFQLGLVNVATGDVKGGALGLVSIAKNGRLQPSVWYSGPGANLMAGVKSVVGYTYSELAIGDDPGRDRPSHQETLGLHLDAGHRLYAEVGGGYGETHQSSGPFTDSSRHLVRSEVRYEARLGFEPIRGVTAFAGGGVTQRVKGQGAEVRGTYFFGLSFF
jgi:hypothetical protein